MAKKKDEIINIIRISKNNVPSIQSKQVFYYIDSKKDEDGKIIGVSYFLLDNRKGKKEITEFDSLKKLEDSIK